MGYIGVITHLLTFYQHFQRDIQVGSLKGFAPKSRFGPNILEEKNPTDGFRMGMVSVNLPISINVGCLFECKGKYTLRPMDSMVVFLLISKSKN